MAVTSHRSSVASIDFIALWPVVIRLDELRFSSLLSEADAEELRVWQQRFSAITNGRQIPPKRFVSDGCTFSPDCFGKRCCELHDLAYWLGGTWLERFAADNRVRACTCTNGHPSAVVRRLAGLYAPIQYAGVRVFGHPRVPDYLFRKGFRWGYGWGYPAPGEPGTVY
jgi:hypothetical protein